MSEPEHVRATQEPYDAVAVEYADLFRTELREMAFGRAFPGAFAELVRARTGHRAPVRVGAGRLRRRPVAGDGGPGPPVASGVRYEVGRLAALDLGDGVLGGLVSWFSFIHPPPAELGAVLAERVEAAGFVMEARLVSAHR